MHLDEVDLRLIGALQVDGRASAARIADVLGLPARTVTRRLQRLLTTHTVRVVRHRTMVDAPAGALFLRARVLRGKVETIANALARRPDVPFVDVHLGGDEISAVVTPSGDGRDPFLLDQLPTTAAVTSWTVQAVLHVFADASSWRTGVLSPDEVAALGGGVVAPVPTGPYDRADAAIVAELSVDARRLLPELAARTHLAESTLRRRLEQLAAAGHCRTVCVVDAALVGFPVDANVSLSVAPGRLDAVGRALAARPEVHGLFATTGATNLQAAVFCRTREDLYRFTTDGLGSLDVAAAEAAIVSHTIKRVGVVHR